MENTIIRVSLLCGGGNDTFLKLIKEDGSFFVKCSNTSRIEVTEDIYECILSKTTKTGISLPRHIINFVVPSQISDFYNTEIYAKL